MKTFLKWLGIGFILLLIIGFALLAINVILPPGWNLSANIFIVLTAAVLSILFTYVPVLRTAFAALPSEHKSLVNLVLVVLLAVFMYIGTCTGLLPIAGIECSRVGLQTLALYVFLAVGGNQITYVASPLPEDVQVEKDARE